MRLACAILTSSLVALHARPYMDEVRPARAAATMATYDPAIREQRYQANFAAYLVDLHDHRATFNFCGGMMFQLVLSEKLRQHLVERSADAAAGGGGGITVYDKEYTRMNLTPGYEQSSTADNVAIFHGREVRNVRGAAGGMNFVLHLSADDDPEGWTQPERQDYNGWGHDSGRPWRKLAQWEAEGVTDFREKFGSEAYGLHHRFFFHLDEKNRFWLSAEDGCEGYAADASTFITR